MQDIFRLIQEMTLNKINKNKKVKISEDITSNTTASIPITPIFEETVLDEDVDDLRKVYNLIFNSNSLFELVDNLDKIPDRVKILVEDEFVEQDIDLTQLNPYFITRLKDLYLLDEIEAFQLVNLFPHLYQYFVATDLGISFYMMFLMIAVIKYYKHGDYKVISLSLDNIYKLPVVWYQHITQSVFEEALKVDIENLAECMRKLVHEKPQLLDIVKSIYPVSPSCVKTLNYFIFNKEPQILADLFSYAINKKDIKYESLVSECGYQIVKMLKNKR